MDIIAGTAGHIDHGKTALIKALTGVDADRLPEEKQRGITIDLGFAELELGDVRFGFVDVPGHERFVKNMLAGASGIDMVMLVIAADEGVMPQTREHFDICRLLETKSGLVVLTKKDLVDDEMLGLVKMEIAELVKNTSMENAPVVAVSSKTGEGMEALRRALIAAARKIPVRNDQFVTRLPIDRSFTVKGFGSVVTGTLASGNISEGDELQLLPTGKNVRVRGLQTHGKTVKSVHAGQRTAVNLGGVEHGEIVRGMVLTARNVLRPTQIIDAEIEALKDVKRSVRSRQRVRVHLGTTEALARVMVLNGANEIGPGDKDFVQLRLEVPVVAVPGERFIIRSYSPQITIAGGSILDPLASKHRRKDILDTRTHLVSLTRSGVDNAARLRLFVETSGEQGFSLVDLEARTGWRREILEKAIKENLERQAIVDADGIFIGRTAFENLKSRTIAEARRHHRLEPLAKGILRETLREKVFAHVPPEMFRSVLADLERVKKVVIEKDTVRLASHSLDLSGDEKTLHDRLLKLFKSAKFEVPKLEDALAAAAANTKLSREQARKIFQLLLNSGEIVKVSDEFYFSNAAVNELIGKLRLYAASMPERLIDVSKFKEIAGVSRKYAIPLLEYFDREKITRRAGDKRIVL